MTDVHHDENLLGTVASAVVAIDELRDLTAFTMPYPPLVQRMLDQVVLHCLRRRATPPKSVPGLVRWAYQRPLGEWPLTLPVGVYPANGFLVDGESGAPTALCHEIALCAEMANPLREASGRMAAVAGLAAERNRPREFSALRDLLVEHPSLTNDQFNLVRFNTDLGTLDEHLGDFYDDIGLEYVFNDQVFPCARCRTPLLRTDIGSWWCEREECGAGQTVSAGTPVDWAPGFLMQVDRRHRQFVSGPGRAVLRIQESLRRSGVHARRSPLHGAGDLKVDSVAGQPCTANVVDWRCPAVLGRAIAIAIERSGVDRAAWVVAQYRVDADPGYLEIVREHATGESGAPRIWSEQEFIDLVLRSGRESPRA